MAVVGPKSVVYRCVIELFCGVVCVVTLPFDISVSLGAFVIGLSQISSFLTWYLYHDFSKVQINVAHKDTVRNLDLVI